MTDPADDKLVDARYRIDAIDRQLQRLLSERGELALEVGRIKSAAGRHDYYRPGREAEILREVAARNTGPLDDVTATRLMREIMAACRALEQPLTIAYLGPEGTYTEAAVHQHFGQSVVSQPQASISGIFREVAADRADYGVAPIENSNQGVVSHTLDQMVDSELTICGEISLGVHHCLLSRAESLDDVREVLAHSQSLEQCRRWLDRHLPGVPRTIVASNGEAARRASESGHTAAIAGRAAATAYELGVHAVNIEDESDNTTRFLVLGKQKVARTGCDMTSIMVAIRNQPGTLYRMLAPAADAGVDLARIESRPSRRELWDYNFFIDLHGHIDDEPVKRALAAIESEAVLLKVLGSYPRGQNTVTPAGASDTGATTASDSSS